MPHFNFFKKKNTQSRLSINGNFNNINTSTSLGLTVGDLPNNNTIATVDVDVQKVRKNGKRKKNWKNALISLDDHATKCSVASSSTIKSNQKNDSENVAEKVHVISRFISTKADDSDILLQEDSLDEEFDNVENDKTKTTLIERYAIIPRRSSETEVLARKGRFTIIREADNNNNVSSRTGESRKSLSSSYSSCCTISQSRSSSCSSLLVSLSDSPDSPVFKGSIKIRSHEQLSPISTYYSNSPIYSSPLSSNYYHYNSKSPRRASDSFAHHQNNLVQFNNKSLPSSYPSHKPTLYILSTSLPRQNFISQNTTCSSPTSLPQLSPAPTPTLISSSLKQYPFTTPSGRKFELEGSYFPNNSTSSSGSNNNFGSKRRRQFIIETFE
ncbi:9667_t:CDS:2 [Funneliformis geosporum]|uniref:9667_t:CDS:1 n=1 Tax=Funneliformis geosporum TaxID=1117311 RepID=A0A9W4WTG7_9GLOM|nr:9667_t:CDS:2 [Funneliformis geosporum]